MVHLLKRVETLPSNMVLSSDRRFSFRMHIAVLG
jgi:hypothetical protein